uniref:Uncharacterized protein n=1 Tax=Arundo donax TaxID=35708 RepID=A0A0A9I3B1_ARUDO
MCRHSTIHTLREIMEIEICVNIFSEISKVILELFQIFEACVKVK